MFYEVFIPSAATDGFDVTITVEADNWMMALKSGLQRTGEGADAVRNVMCDIQEDNTILVTDASTRRVFVLRELGEEAADEQQAVDEQAADEQAPAELSEDDRATPILGNPAAPPEPVPDEATADDTFEEPIEESGGLDEPSWTSEDGRMRIGSSTHEALRRDEEKPRVLREERVPTGQRRDVPVGRGDERVSENILEEVFLEMNAIHERDMTMEEVVNFVMDMAMAKIGAEAGSIMFADINGKELYFATARGPKAEDVMDFRIPMGVGIAGFCAREGVSLAISDAERDPRFYARISEALGYETQSLACAPIQYEGRVFGAIELMNKANHHFESTEVNVLTYVGRQLARYINDLIMAREQVD